MAHATLRPNNSTATLTRRRNLGPGLKPIKGPKVFTVKNLHDSGPDSLRDAVKYANSHPKTTVDFAVRLHGTIKLTSGELIIAEHTTIKGPGAAKLAVSGTNHSRVFNIKPGMTAIISGLTITEGLADTHELEFKGFGGGILNQGTLTLDHCVVCQNHATGVAGVTVPLCGPLLTGAAAGGGVANLGTLFVCNTKFAKNQVQGASTSKDPGNKNTYPGVASGGGLFNVGMATAIVSHCSFTENLVRGGDECISGTGMAGDAAGGAIASFGFSGTTANTATLTISHCTFSKNQAIGGSNCQSPLLPGHSIGGAVASHRFSGVAELIVSHCKFDHNHSIGGDFNVISPTGSDPRALANMPVAGGLFVCGKAMISDSTFDHNRAHGGQGTAGSNGGDARGGGLAFAFNQTVVAIVACTIKHNFATGGAAGDGATGGNAWGAGIEIAGPLPIVTVVDSTIESNVAQGGDGNTSGAASNGGEGVGGGIYAVAGSTTTLVAGSITDNRANDSSGQNGGNDGEGKCGGVCLLGDATFDSTTITGNHAATCCPDICT